MKKIGLLILFLLFLIGCSPTEAQINAAIEETNTAKPTDTSEPSSIATEKPTITSTATVSPTPPLRRTKKPSNTPTPTPEPLFFEGSGDDVIEIDKWDDPAVVDITRDGGGHFAVTSYGKNGEYIDLLVNTIGPYEGKVTMNLMGYDGTNVGLLEINANGPWTISIYPFHPYYVNHVDAPGFYENDTDDVLAVEGESATATFTCATGGNFAVWGLGNDVNLMVNAIAPYEGKVMVPDGLVLLIVKAENDWRVEFN